MTLPVPDILLVGNVCRDILPGGGDRPGGAVYYAAAAASKLGFSVGVVTVGGGEVSALRDLPRTTVVAQEVRHSTAFENLYDRDGGRTQVCRGLAHPISPDMLPPEWSHPPVALFCPVAGEVPPVFARLVQKSLLGIAAQGYLRSISVGAPVGYQPWIASADVLAQATAVFYSEEDLHGHLPEWLAFRGPLVVTTRGNQGCDISVGGKRRAVAGYPRSEVDPTGAGDVFAAAFLLDLQRQREPLAAARFANCAASFSVEGQGIDSLATLDEVEGRLATTQVETALPATRQ